MVDGISGAKPTLVQTPSAVEGARNPKLTRPVAANLPQAVLSREATGLVQDMASRPPVDTSRVAELKARIDAGAFRVEPDRIADAMIAQERGAPKVR